MNELIQAVTKALKEHRYDDIANVMYGLADGSISEAEAALQLG